MHLKSRIEQFIHLEVLGGLLLFAGFLLALVVSNTELYDEYQSLIKLPISIKIGDFSINKPLLKWVNDGLMALFFLLLTLEIKFHCLEGEFTSRATLRLPIIAAIGGATVPAIIYYLFNYSEPTYLQGWAIPIATDTAFTLAVLSFLKHKLPVSAKIFTIALSILDDLIAILVISLFYTDSLFIIPLLIAIICIFILATLNFMNVGKFSPYLIIGVILWLALVEAGIHGTIAGVIIGLSIPMRVLDHHNKLTSPLKKLEHSLHPAVALIILPLFAFLNCEIPFKELSMTDLFSNITLGTVAGLFIGKQFGIMALSFLAVKLGICRLPVNISWRTYYGISVLCGIGFTFSLFIGLLSFDHSSLLNQMKLGVVLGSFLSAGIGVLILRRLPSLPANYP
ncbi:MAG: Na+/H+ antiporter NhaA [Candidatus Paracaedibacter sp.]